MSKFIRTLWASTLLCWANLLLDQMQTTGALLGYALLFLACYILIGKWREF